MYGFTEAFRSTCLFPDELEARPDSIGKPLPGVEISVVNEQGEECRPFEVGELVHYGAMITQGYWNDPEMTKMKFQRDHVYSGDLVKRDEDGYFYFVGRKDRMMKVKGYRVSPLEVEAILMQMDVIRQCHVAGRESEEGTVVTAFIQKADEDLNVVEVKQFCRENAPYYLVPDDVVFVEEFPITASGKIDGKALLEHKETADAV
jgi:acyl-coenzyme A synthetase/AMP-(fatty) acid ligase